MEKLNELKNLIQEKSILKHPFYKAWAAGLLSPEDLRNYACQYYHHVRAFPTYVAGIIANCENPRLRSVLLKNLIDEEGSTPTHLDLWVDFGRSLGLTRGEMENSEVYPETRHFVDTFRHLTRNYSAPVGASALYAYESQIPAVAAEKIEGLKKYEFGTNLDVAFFSVHQEADVKHTADLEKVMVEVRPEEEEKARLAVHQVLSGWWGLLDGVLARSSELKEKVAACTM
ncbi:MAG: CADD family putative folate metabolism protein [candidate division Zixibacteria bacterium]|nr:CADD family putative folate metabolism protein [candidate division Zixibacteria bacterium]MCI0595191.1 CADD family putative folate metabolism protein [candidate division Zixibacteria bacterium]